MYESVESEERERPVCRCNDCLNQIKKAEEDLVKSMQTMDFHTVDRSLSFINNKKIDIDVKLRHQGEVTHLKLDKELDIRNFIKSVDQIDDYKTILKSVKTLNDKVEKARELDVDLDPMVIAEVNRCTSRLISERNLRFKMEMSKVPSSTNETVDDLKGLIEKA